MIGSVLIAMGLAVTVLSPAIPDIYAAGYRGDTSLLLAALLFTTGALAITRTSAPGWLIALPIAIILSLAVPFVIGLIYSPLGYWKYHYGAILSIIIGLFYAAVISALSCIAALPVGRVPKPMMPSTTTATPHPVVIGRTADGRPVFADQMATQQNPKTNTMAVLALVFGVMGGFLGIVFGHIALSQIKRTGEQGRGMALAGLILGYIGLAVTIVAVAALVFVLGAM
ncbi:hypothetical protein MTP03_40170 [Tsukamurella sp. PLM1]|nr:hypothetical protein MTP03_40170 [Tsukamurella sp. PLM1]